MLVLFSLSNLGFLQPILIIYVKVMAIRMALGIWGKLRRE